MRCPYCHVDNDRVLDTRAMDDGYTIRRRRCCNACRRRFSTFERMERSSLRVIKRDETRELFDAHKLFRGIERACWKRPIGTERIQELAQKIENEIFEQFEVEVHSQQIGQIVMEHLSSFDEVAYIRFASVYRDFANAEDFIQEISPYLPQPKNRAPAIKKNDLPAH